MGDWSTCSHARCLLSDGDDGCRLRTPQRLATAESVLARGGGFDQEGCPFLRSCSRAVGGLSRAWSSLWDAVDDLVQPQSIFLLLRRVLERAGRLGPDQVNGSFLRDGVVFAARDVLRSTARNRRRDHLVTNLTDLPADEHGAAAVPGPDDLERRRLWDALDALRVQSPGEYALIQRLVFDGLAKRALAEELGVTRRILDRMISSALSALRRLLEERGHDH